MKKMNGWAKWIVLLVTIVGTALAARDRFIDLERKVDDLTLRMAVVEKVPSLEARMTEVERRVVRLEAIADTNRDGIRSIDSKLSEISGMLKTHMMAERGTKP